MKRITFIIVIISTMIVSSCSSTESIGAAEVAESYINALAEKNKPLIVSLSCKEWEESAILEVDALLSVEAAVSELSCDVTSEQDESNQVVCSGSLDLTYNDEIRAIDLSRRTYTLRIEDGQWRVCAYQ